MGNFQQQLLSWFDSNARDLPWRKTADPYRIWVSEIMLQQTRVNAVLDHYSRFLALFPTVNALAKAEESAVLAAWSGLGYYRRARMMHQAAKVIVDDYRGVFPKTAAELRNLPGIGEYTSSAIASIAFGESVAVVDGNVERVLYRVYPDHKKQAKWLRDRAASLVDPDRPGDFNQSMMELGATVCLPQRPLCLHCPVQPFCATRGEHATAPPKKMHNRQIAYALCSSRARVLLQQRPVSASLMPGMWELPEVGMQPDDHQRIELTERHAITVTNYRVHVLRYSREEARALATPHPLKWTRTAELGSLPLTGLTRKILLRLKIMTMTKTILAALLGIALYASAQTMPAVPVIPGVPVAARQAAASIDPLKIGVHVSFLASDLLEGRGPGARGGELAAEYMATQFALAGARPAGDNGTFFQRIPFIAVHTEADKTHFTLVPANGAPIPLVYEKDYLTKNQTGAAAADIDAPIVFVGYGIEAAEYHWNDYANLDVKGKILLVIVNEPPSDDQNFFQGKALTYYGRWTYKFEEAARRGAIGVLIIHRTDLASYGFQVLVNSQSTETSYLRNDPLSTLQAASWIQLDTARKLFAAAGMDVDREIEAAGQRGFQPVELPIRLQAHIASRVREYESSNVIAMVPGANPSQGGNVIYTAHYDHLGIDPDAVGDKIYNGAADNGTGSAILLEMVRAFASAKTRPPRNVYFASVTAEEQGLLGSEYLGKHPPQPIRDFALDLNFDELLPLGIPTSVRVAGAERTSFYPVVEKTAAAFHLEIQPDDSPMAGHYYRSDHFSFARVGVPAFSVDEGILFAGHDAAWGRKQKQDYDEQHYHRPSDEYRPDMDFRADARLAQFGFILGWQALSSGAITWKAGDEFEAARQKSMQ